MLGANRWKSIPGVPVYTIHKGTCCRQLTSDIENLAFKTLETPKPYLEEGDAMREMILGKLQHNKYGIKVDRIRLAGSVGKRTCISYVNKQGDRINPDFDVVPFLNDMTPPFEKALDMLEEIVRGIPRVRNINVTKIAVQFEYNSPTNGPLKFDLVPAGNYVKQPCHAVDIARIAAWKAEQLLQSQANHGVVTNDLLRIHSTAFSEKGLEIIKNYVLGDPMFQGVVRLAKYWTSQIDFGDIYVAGRSYIIELIAIRCQRGKKRKCLISCFRRFLEAVSVFGQLVMFSHVRHDNPGLTEILAKSRKPIICNIANPIDNLADGMDRTVIQIFEEQARMTLKVLDTIKDQGEYNKVSDPICKIFRHKY